jgi:sulfide:quinone oxidoreductase
MRAKIVALTDSFAVASQITADDISEIAAAGYRSLINNRPDNEEPDQLESGDARRRAGAVGLEYHYLPITASTLTVKEIDAFEKLIAQAEGPILAHCRSGTRCYLLWAAIQLRKGAASADSLIRQAADKGFDITALQRFSAQG